MHLERLWYYNSLLKLNVNENVQNPCILTKAVYEEGIDGRRPKYKWIGGSVGRHVEGMQMLRWSEDQYVFILPWLFFTASY